MSQSLKDKNNEKDVPLYWRESFFTQFQSDFVLSSGRATRAWWSCRDEIFISGFHGPFGGFHANANLVDEISSQEIKENLLDLRKKLAIETSPLILRVRTYPEEVFPDWSPGQELSLLQSGFKQLYRERVHYVSIQGDFKNYWRRNRIRDFNKTSKFLFVEEANTKKNKLEVYQILNNDAVSKGRIFPLTEEMFQSMCNNLNSEEMNLFLCFDKRTRSSVAAAICQVLDNKAIYIYRWGGSMVAENAQISSPITFLANFIYNYYQDLDMQTLYLGTSSINGVINSGLASFKESLGAKSSTKGVYELNTLDIIS
jgi:hypothetical protein